MSKVAHDCGIYLALMIASLAVYAQVRQFDFVNFDDYQYVRDNPYVRQGLTARSVAWAFTSGDDANWFPVTRLSHLVDGQLFGNASGPPHLVNAMLHALAALLLFAFLRRATGARWPSAFVAAVFALHPLHVESVAWVAERKDVLSACLWFLALWCYVRYAERPNPARYLAVVAAFALGLLAKPMIVTLPFVLLLLDAWPLERWRTRPWGALMWEKAPLLALSAASAMVTFVVQRRGGAVDSLANFSGGLRLENALVSYVMYIAQTLWPSRLAVVYLRPLSLPVWQPVLAGFGIAAATALALSRRRELPYLAVGWFWYLGTLVPVIGLVQVGSQARADRYMYVPMVGLAIMAAWGAADVAKRWPAMRPVVASLAVAACAGMMPMAWLQIGYWRNSVSLWEHAIAVTRDNSWAHYNLALVFSEMPGRRQEAIEQFEATLADKPDDATAHNKLGNTLAQIPGRLTDAIGEYRLALHFKPDYADAYNNLGVALENTPGGMAEAVSEFQSAIYLNPGFAAAHNNLGDALTKLGRLPEAVEQFETALRINPGNASAHNNLGIAFAGMQGRLDDAIAQFEAALRFRPNYASAHMNLGVALARIPGRLADAIAEYQSAERLEPNSPLLHNNLGNALSQTPGGLPGAIAEYETALRLDPNFAYAHYRLGTALAKTPGRMQEAQAHFDRAHQLNSSALR
jgi:tetratricopeptide (TPR) repeat protein